MKWVEDGDLKGERVLPGKFFMKEDMEDDAEEEAKEGLDEQEQDESLLQRHAEGAVDLTDEEKARMPVLPLSELQLSSAPAEWDVRTGRTCRAFKRESQGTCGSYTPPPPSASLWRLPPSSHSGVLKKKTYPHLEEHTN